MSKFFIKKEGSLYFVYIRGVDKHSDVRMEGLAALTLEEAQTKLKAASLIFEAKMLAAKVATIDIDVVREAATAMQSINNELWIRSRQDWYCPEEREEVEIEGTLYRPVEFWQ